MHLHHPSNTVHTTVVLEQIVQPKQLLVAAVVHRKIIVVATTNTDPDATLPQDLLQRAHGARERFECLNNQDDIHKFWQSNAITNLPKKQPVSQSAS